MGHEYVEMKNTTTAIQCYLQAVRSNKLDYRAWYGLGQAYEMLHLYSYAIYYYKKATTIRSNDSRMWYVLIHFHSLHLLTIHSLALFS